MVSPALTAAPVSGLPVPAGILILIVMGVLRFLATLPLASVTSTAVKPAVRKAPSAPPVAMATLFNPPGNAVSAVFSLGLKFVTTTVRLPDNGVPSAAVSTSPAGMVISVAEGAEDVPVAVREIGALSAPPEEAVTVVVAVVMPIGAAAPLIFTRDTLNAKSPARLISIR